ncbi:hypothetical protein B0H19DRAFT_1235155 [Mycena capillaripes]|nr:hypothetical protein B0H19DRAFT_1235155 [Mycena capillaripes]
MQSLKYSGYALLLLATCHWPELCPSSRTGFDSCRELFGFGVTPIDRARREARARPMKNGVKSNLSCVANEQVAASPEYDLSIFEGEVMGGVCAGAASSAVWKPILARPAGSQKRWKEIYQEAVLRLPSS